MCWLCFTAHAQALISLSISNGFSDLDFLIGFNNVMTIRRFLGVVSLYRSKICHICIFCLF